MNLPVLGKVPVGKIHMKILWSVALDILVTVSGKYSTGAVSEWENQIRCHQIARLITT